MYSLQTNAVRLRFLSPGEEVQHVGRTDYTAESELLRQVNAQEKIDRHYRELPLVAPSKKVLPKTSSRPPHLLM
jgi:hypothetical protein